MTAQTDIETIAIHSPNWLGDVVMCLPAFHVWRGAHANTRVCVVARKSVAGLWKFIRGVNAIVPTAKDTASERVARQEIRSAGCRKAIVLPNSFRSAWVLWRSGIRQIRGTAGQFRSFMISDAVSLDGLDEAHQSVEYARIFGVSEDGLPAPSDAIDASLLPEPPQAGIDLSGGFVAVLPGAARGPSKRYPAPMFIEAVSAALARHQGLAALVCGTPSEAAECAEVADGLSRAFPGRAADLCGKTSLASLAALLHSARAVCCNDSGGMHLATAVGAPVAAVFGMTDPRKTGPIGRSRVVAAEGVTVSRSIARESGAAARALASIAPTRVATALEEVMG
jgi:heptosyltransferase-2